MNPEDYVSYPIALALKKAGFDYPCYFYYTRKDSPDDHVWSTTSEEAPIDYNRSVYAGCSMPTLAQAQKWLRDKKKIDIELRVWLVGGTREYRPYIMPPKSCDFIAYPPEKSYESALSAGIAAALELPTPQHSIKHTHPKT